MAFLENLFTGQPTTIVDAYANTASALNNLRKQRIANALSQIQLQYAPQMEQSAASKAAAEALTAQNTAKYAPQMSLADLAQKHAQTIYENAETVKSNLLSKGIQLDNISKAAEAQGAPQKVQNALKLQQAQIATAYAKANSISNAASQKSMQTGYDPTTGLQVQYPKQNYAPPLSGIQNLSPISRTPMIAQQSLGGAPGEQMNIQNAAQEPNKVPNLFLPAGPSSARGVPSGLYNPATKESLSVMTPQQRTQIQNQVTSIKQAKELLPAITAYGTTGKFQATGISKYFPQWAGGVSFDDAAKYDMAKNLGVEHLMTATKLNKTDETINMMKTVISRQNGESREGYTERMNEFNKKLDEINKERLRDLRLGGIPLNESDTSPSQLFLMDSYDKALKARGDKSSLNATVRMIGSDGKPYRIPSNKAEDAIKNYNMKLAGQ